MKIGRWSFTPALLPGLITALLLPALLALGFWQLDRADQKRFAYTDYQRKASQAAIDLNEDPPDSINVEKLFWRKAKLNGYFFQGKTYLLDNQVLQGKVGYHVLSPVRLDGKDEWILVNRGWIAVPGERRDNVPQISTTAGLVTITGVLNGLPSTGLDPDFYDEESLGQGIVRIQKVDLGKMGGGLDGRLIGAILKQDSGTPGGFERLWPEPGTGMERHLGYAFQWFSLAAALLILFVVVNTKRMISDD